MSHFTMYVRIDGEPFLSRATAYRDRLAAARKLWWEFAAKVGANALTDPLGALAFAERPKGWVSMKTSDRYRPRKGSPEEAEMAALPRQPNTYDIFGDAVMFDLSYEGPDVRGSGAIGMWYWGPSISWTTKEFYAAFPDASKAAAAHLKEHPDRRITNGADLWKLPAGLTEVTKAELDLAFAQARVEDERREKAAA